MATFSDDFNRADGSPGANWVQVSGTWTIVSQQLSSGNAGGTIILRAATAMATSDHSVQITIAATAAVSHGVWARGNSNITQGYLLRNDGTSWNIFSVVGGSFSSIGSYAAAAAAGDVAKLQVVGTSIKGYINGTLRISITDTAVTTGTSVGIRAESTSSLRFDDFSSADVTAGATGDAALSSTATLSATGLRATTGAAALTATAGLTASGLRATAGSAALASTASLAADGTRSTSGAAGLTTTAALSANGQRGAQADAGITAIADLTAQGQIAHSGDAALMATATLTGDGTTATSPGSAALSVAATLTAAGTTATAGTAALAATATLTASGTTNSTADDIDVTVGAPYSAWTVGRPYAPAWTVQEPQTGDWEVGAPC
jgi:hypothetical protein